MVILPYRRKAFRGGGFSPNDLSPELWLRPEELGADSTLVTNWPDQSVNGNDATQGTTSAKPLVQASVLDGYSGALFDGVDDSLTMDSQIDLAGAFEIWTVFATSSEVAKIAKDNSNYPLDLSGGTANTRPAGSGKIGVSAAATFVAGTHLLRLARDGSDDYTCEKDGVDVTLAGPPNVSGTAPITKIGVRGATYGGGHLLEAVIAASAFAAGDVASMNAYFSGRYPTLSI